MGAAVHRVLRQTVISARVARTEPDMGGIIFGDEAQWW